MAYHGILECFQQPERWFTGVVVTNGAGSPRDDLYADYTDEQMRRSAARSRRRPPSSASTPPSALLDYPSAAVKDPTDAEVRSTTSATLLAAAQPEVVYTHNLADKHDTHVAVRCA